MRSWGKLGREGLCPTEGVVPAHPGILASDPQRGWSLHISGSPPLIPTRGWSLYTHSGVRAYDPKGRRVVPANPCVLASDLPRFGFVNGALDCLTRAGAPRPMGKGQPHLSPGSLNPTWRQAGQRGWGIAPSC